MLLWQALHNWAIFLGPWKVWYCVFFFFKYLSCLQNVCNVFNHIHPALRSPTQFRVLLIGWKPIKFNLCCPYVLGCVAFHWSVVSPNFLSTSSYQWSIAPQLGGRPCAPPPLHTGIWSDLSLHSSRAVVTSGVRSLLCTALVQLPFSVWTMLFPCGHSLPLGLFSFLPLFCCYLWAVGMVTQMSHLEMSIPQGTTASVKVILFICQNNSGAFSLRNCDLFSPRRLAQ